MAVSFLGDVPPSITSTQVRALLGAQVTVAGNRIVVANAYRFDDVAAFGPTPVIYDFDLGPLRAGNYKVELLGAPPAGIPNSINQRTIHLEFAVLTQTQAKKGVIEIPAEDSVQSGIGLISGWSCVADSVEVSIDGRPRIRVPSESPRADVEPVCSHSNAGFGLLWNYNTMSEGEHTIQLYVKTVPIGEPRKFKVVKPKGEFARGLSKQVTVPDFPDAGKSTTLDWREGEQRFGIKSVQ
jgi:hypothetical protein